MAGAVAARADWELPAEPASVTLARGWLREFAESHGVRPQEVIDLTLAVTEAVTNSVIHAYIGRDPGTICVRAITTTASLPGSGFSSRCGTHGGT